MILLIDNYDSFSYNLYQLVGTINPDIKVIRNDEMSIDEIEALNPDRIIISPGPGKPADAGVCEEVVTHFMGKLPILGVCLGHQAICESLGGVVSYAKRLMHGKSSVASYDVDAPIFAGITEADDEDAGKVLVARYHSLSAIEDKLPDCLKVIAKSDDDGEIMAVKHKDYDLYGLQFHPESILTPKGIKMLRNFCSL